VRLLALMPDLTDPRTCQALEDLDIDALYVDRELYVGSAPHQAQFENLDRVPSSGVELVDRADTVALYEITTCD
jgi:hypothetical protein